MQSNRYLLNINFKNFGEESVIQKTFANVTRKLWQLLHLCLNLHITNGCKADYVIVQLRNSQTLSLKRSSNGN